jgi:hypothetical protein
MEARQCLLLAFGSKKAQAIAAAVEGPITSLSPASILQMHANVKVCLDTAAAAELQRADYYRWVHDNKPVWQKFLDEGEGIRPINSNEATGIAAGDRLRSIAAGPPRGPGRIRRALVRNGHSSERL